LLDGSSPAISISQINGGSMFAKRPLRRIILFLAVIGPAIITSSADNDAGGIATYAIAGASYGYALLWSLLIITFGEAIVQEMAARMGAVTGKGLSALIREEFGVRVTFLAMLGLLFANIGTTMAEFAGIAASLQIFGISKYISVPLAALFIWRLVARGSYNLVEKTLLTLCLALFAYIISGFMVGPSWGKVLLRTLLPSLRFDSNYILLLIASFGTTLTPWMQFYLQSSVTEKGITMRDYPFTRLEVFLGSFFSNLVSWFIVVTTAATLFVHGISIDSAGDAALALAPLAGRYAGALFALGLLGASTLAAAVLPLSTAYAICEAFGWERGVDKGFEEASLFYGLYTGIVIIGAVATLIPGISLMKIMMLSQAVNGFLLPAILILMIRLANNRRIMGNHINGRLPNAVAWFTAMFVALTTASLLLRWIF